MCLSCMQTPLSSFIFLETTITIIITKTTTFCLQSPPTLGAKLRKRYLDLERKAQTIAATTHRTKADEEKCVCVAIVPNWTRLGHLSRASTVAFLLVYCLPTTAVVYCLFLLLTPFWFFVWFVFAFWIAFLEFDDFSAGFFVWSEYFQIIQFSEPFSQPLAKTKRGRCCCSIYAVWRKNTSEVSLHVTQSYDFSKQERFVTTETDRSDRRS